MEQGRAHHREHLEVWVCLILLVLQKGVGACEVNVRPAKAVVLTASGIKILSRGFTPREKDV